MLLLSSHKQILQHLDMALRTKPNPMVILVDTTRTTKHLEATTAITKEAIKVSKAMAKTKGMQETIITKVTPSSLNHQLQQCITTRVDHTTVDTTPTSHNHSSSKSRTITTTTRALGATMLELKASSQLLLHRDTMDKHRHSISQSSNTIQVVITKTPQDQEGTQTGKIQASNQI